MTLTPSSPPTALLAAEIRGRLGPPPTMSEWPLVSLIVVSHDGARQLRNLFRGLEQYTDYPEIELIFVDNDSSDDSVRFIELRDTPFEVTTIANAHNESFSGACNQGAKQASGDLLLFLNNDVEPFEPGWLRELVACRHRTKAGAVAATLLCSDKEHARTFSHGYGVQHRGLSFADEDGHAVPGLRGWEDDPLDRGLGVDLDCDAIAAACLLISRTTYRDVGGFSPGYFYGCEDVDLCLKLRSAGQALMCSGRSIAIHHPASTRRLMPFDQAHRTKLANRELLWERWGPNLRCT